MLSNNKSLQKVVINLDDKIISTKLVKSLSKCSKLKDLKISSHLEEVTVEFSRLLRKYYLKLESLTISLIPHKNCFHQYNPSYISSWELGNLL